MVDVLSSSTITTLTSFYSIFVLVAISSLGVEQGIKFLYSSKDV